MANLFVTEFGRPKLQEGLADIGAWGPPLRTQVKAFTTSAAIDNAIGSDCYMIRVYVDGDAHIEFGSAPTATTGSMPIAADLPEYFAVNPSDSLKVAAIAQV